jgi:hypothetical protein
VAYALLYNLYTKFLCFGKFLDVSNKEVEKGAFDMHKQKSKFIIGLFIVAVFMVVPSLATVGTAKADMTYNFSSTFNGTSPTSKVPWLTATFSSGVTNSVRLTLTSSLEEVSEFISQFGFDSSITALALTYESGYLSAAEAKEYISIKGTGGIHYDILFDFPSSNNKRFNGTDIVIFNITGSGLTEGSFSSLAAHVQGGGTSGAISGTPVPIPPAVYLFGAGLLGLVGLRRRLTK